VLKGLVLNMRGIALRRQGRLQGAAESYRAADDICEEFEDTANWAVVQANFGKAFLHVSSSVCSYSMSSWRY